MRAYWFTKVMVVLAAAIDEVPSKGMVIGRGMWVYEAASWFDDLVAIVCLVMT